MTDDAVVGQLGEVVVRVLGGDVPGEVLTTRYGVREKFVAYAAEPLDRGQRVLVTAVRGPRQVDVIAWTD